MPLHTIVETKNPRVLQIVGLPGQYGRLRSLIVGETRRREGNHADWPVPCPSQPIGTPLLGLQIGPGSVSVQGRHKSIPAEISIKRPPTEEPQCTIDNPEEEDATLRTNYPGCRLDFDQLLLNAVQCLINKRYSCTNYSCCSFAQV